MQEDQPNGAVRAAAGHLDLEADLSLMSLVNAAFRHRRLLIGVPMALAFLAGVMTLLTPRYVARSAFLPEGRSGLGTSQLVGLAAQFGFGAGFTGEQPPPDFYVTLVRSRYLLSQVATRTYTMGDGDEDTNRMNLLDYYEISGGTAEERLLRCVKILQGVVQAGAEPRTGIVSVNVTLGNRSLAEQVNRAVLDLVVEFNQKSRQSRAGAERRFVGERLVQAERELREAENELRAFYEQNRSYEQSPRLVFEATRLESEVARHRGIVNSLGQTFEEARIEEVRDTPVVTMVDMPEGSADNTSRLRPVLLGGILGFLLAMSVALGREYLARQRDLHPDQYAEFQANRHRLLRGWWPRFRHPG